MITGTEEDVGGLVGRNSSAGIISECYATVTVTGDEGVGGLVGQNRGTISSSYATGEVAGESGIGGLIGWNEEGGVSDCYAACVVNGTGDVGGLIGGSDITAITATGCFWDVEISGQVGGGGGKGLTTAQMKTISIFQNAGWASKGWVIDDGLDYPRLAWEGTASVPIPEAEPIPLDGAGTEEDPYLVGTVEEFALLSWHIAALDKHFLLTVDLNVAGATLYPIGDMGLFTGVFEGDGHVIRNATIALPGSDLIGLFGYVGSSGQIRNLGAEDVNFSGRYGVGGLAGFSLGSISGCYATGNVEGYFGVGGLCGGNDQGNISNCYARVSITGENYLGGLSGVNWNGSISNCYATGSVMGGDNSPDLGGFCGEDDEGIISNCFWDVEISGIGLAGDDNFGAVGKTADEMRTLSTFVDAGWVFDGGDWMMLREGEDYPRLGWQVVFVGDIAGLYGVDLVDFGEVALHWGEEGCPSDCGDADIDGDGVVGVGDLVVLAEGWMGE